MQREDFTSGPRANRSFDDGHARRWHQAKEPASGKIAFAVAHLMLGAMCGSFATTTVILTFFCR